MKARFPVVSDDLLKALEEAFPDKAPRKAVTNECELGVLIGQQVVMDFIRQKHSKQNILEG